MNMHHPILVTGAAGFIGKRTSEFLLDDGRRVIGIDNLACGGDMALKRWRLQELGKRPNFSFERLDIEDMPSLRRLFSSYAFSTVINLAARAGVRRSVDAPHAYMSTNAVGTLNVLECMREFRVEKLIMASSSSLYAGSALPFAETYPANILASPYAVSKKTAEVLAGSYHHLYGIDVSILRYFTTIGPAARFDMSLLHFIKCIDEGRPIDVFGDGTQRRDFVYVDDIARGTIAAIKPLGCEIINLGNGKRAVSINEMISHLEELLGKKAKINRCPLNKADIKDTLADIKKARDLLRWEPKTYPLEGFRLTAEWYLRNKKCLSESMPS